jgi:dipeptidyl aminopeptidase/acylaminoacyl peptidase
MRGMSLRRAGALVSCLGVACALAACGSTGTGGARAAAPTDEAASSGPPAEAFFGHPLLASPRLSPDGARVVGVTARDGARMLVEKSLRDDEVLVLEKIEDPAARVAFLGWSGATRAVAGIRRPARSVGAAASTLELRAYEIDRYRPVQIANRRRIPAADAGPLLLHWLPGDPDQVLLARPQSGGGTSVHRTRVRDGIGSQVSPEAVRAERWFVDFEGRVRAASGPDPEGLGDAVWARPDDASDLEPLVDDDLASESSLAFAGFAADPGMLYVYADTEEGRRGVYRYDLTARRRGALVASHPHYDAARLLYEPAGGRFVAVEFEGERPERVFVDAAAEREQAAIDATFPGTANRIVDADGAGRIALFEVSSDVRPPEFYVYDREARTMDLLAASHPALASVDLAPMRAVSYPARDGLSIPAYLTLPPGVPPRGLPVVVIVHDGPTDRVRWGWDARAQFLASRGFAVFQPNYRGSSGYGREFERLGLGAWGGAMQDDLVDGVAWLVAEGVADPGRVGIFGKGYGGYAALLAPLAAPGVFGAAASWGGIFDLVDLLERPERYALSDPNTPLAWATPRDRERLAALSPLQRAAGLETPVLLGHGERDRVVPAAQTRALADALGAAGRAVETHLYRDADHALRSAEDRITFHEALAAFFGRTLAPHGASESAEPREGGGS